LEGTPELYRHRTEHDIKMDLKETGCESMNWIEQEIHCFYKI
jgi:hypothetical protein